MRWPQLVVYLYGLFMVVLGTIGGLGLAGGKPSPQSFAGTVMGVIIITFGFMVAKNPRLAYIGTTVLALLNVLRFIPQFHSAEGKLFPHGLIGYTSLLVVALLTAAHFLAKSKPAEPAPSA